MSNGRKREKDDAERDKGDVYLSRVTKGKKGDGSLPGM
jgi:hypothetical protein